MPETTYTPNPKPNNEPVPSREFDAINVSVAGITSTGAFTITTTDSPQLVVNDGTDDVFTVYTDTGEPVVKTDAFTWLTREDTDTTGTPVLAELYHAISAGTPQNNIGVSLDYRCDTATAERSFLGRVMCLATTAATPITSEIRTSVNVAGVTTEILRIHGSGLSLFATQVVGSRKTGWTAATGTPTRTTFVTGSVTLPQLAERVKALIDDLISHGLIGT